MWQTFWRAVNIERQFLLRNPWDLAAIVWLPLLSLFLIWWIFSSHTITNLPVGVVQSQSTPLGDAIIRYVDATPEVAVVSVYSSLQEAQDDIMTRQIYGVIHIPDDAQSRVLSATPIPVVLSVNAQYGTHSGIIQKGVQSAIGTLSASLEIKKLVKQGVSISQAYVVFSPIKVQRLSLFNPATDYQQFLASTVLPALLHILAMVAGATVIGRELRDKTLGEWFVRLSPASKMSILLSTQTTQFDLAPINRPLKNPESVIANRCPQISLPTIFWALQGKYFLPNMAFVLWSAVAVTLAVTTIKVNMASVLLTFIALLLLMQLSFWLGAVFTLLTYSLRIGLSATGFISAPSYAFAGVTYPYIALSDGAKYWSDILPLTHYLNVHITQLQMGAPVFMGINTLTGLLLAVLCCVFLTAVLTKRALQHPQRWGAR